MLNVGIKELAIIHRGAHSRTGPVVSYSKLNLLQKRLVHALDLDRFSAVQVIQNRNSKSQIPQ
jgi:hypothetical protein